MSAELIERLKTNVSDKYPVGSTARVYYRMDGTQATLAQMIASEPAWVESRWNLMDGLLRECLAALSQVAAVPDSTSLELLHCLADIVREKSLHGHVVDGTMAARKLLERHGYHFPAAPEQTAPRPIDVFNPLTLAEAKAQNVCRICRGPALPKGPNDPFVYHFGTEHAHQSRIEYGTPQQPAPGCVCGLGDDLICSEGFRQQDRGVVAGVEYCGNVVGKIMTCGHSRACHESGKGAR